MMTCTIGGMGGYKEMTRGQNAPILLFASGLLSSSQLPPLGKMCSSSLVFAILLVSCAAVLASPGASPFDYHPGSEWHEHECHDGEKQSPINIVTADALPPLRGASPPEIGTFGKLSKYTVFFTGVALQVAFDEWEEEADIKIAANEYTIGNSTKVKTGDMLAIEPLQLHFHTTSEHTVNGMYAPSELHIVTRVKDGESDYCDEKEGCLAVFGVLLAHKGEGYETASVLDRLFSEMPTDGTGHDNGIEYERELDLDQFLPKSKSHYHYLGSLTTPPCSEKVTWHVFEETLPMSITAMELHQTLVSFTPGEDCTFTFFGVCTPPREKTNNRGIQPLFGRDVYYFAEEES